MTKRDFFILLIKTCGLYSLIASVFFYFPWNLVSTFYSMDVSMLLIVMGFVGLVLGIFFLLIRHAERIVNWLKLDQGFDDERIELGNVNAAGLVSIAIIIIAGFLIVDYFPAFIYHCLSSFKETVETKGLEAIVNTFEKERVQYVEWAIAGINLIIGFLLLTNYRIIARWIIKTNSKNIV